MGKICFFCGSNKVIKKGLKQGKQRWLYKTCGHIFTPSSRIKDSQVIELYSQGNLTVRQIATQLKVNERTIYRHLAKCDKATARNNAPGSVIAMMDTSYWGWNFGVVAIKDHISGEMLWHKFINRKERVDDYVEGVRALEKDGHKIICIVSDGLKGLRERLSGYRYQYCQFHQLQTIKRKLTNHPKLPASIELLDISRLLCRTDKESFEGVMNEWFVRWEAFIKERSTDSNGRSHYTHKNLRSAYLSLKRNMPYLWTFYNNIELGIPNTNNEMESLFSWLKRKLNIHNGMSLERRKMLIERLFYARKPSR